MDTMEFNGIDAARLLTGARQEGLQAKLPQEKAREAGIAVVFRLKAAQGLTAAICRRSSETRAAANKK